MIRHLLFSLLVSTAVMSAHDVPSNRLATTTLRRVTSEGVARAAAFYQKKMNTTRVGAAGIGIAALTGAAYLYFKPKGGGADLSSAAASNSADAAPVVGQDENPVQTFNNHWIELAVKSAVFGTLAKVLFRTFDSATDALSNVVSRLYFGYESWHFVLKERLLMLTKEVRRRLYDACKQEQATPYEQELVDARKRRNNPLYQANVHHRLDLVTDYQLLIRDLERFLGLLVVVRGNDDPLLEQDVASFIAAVDHVSSNLEYDLNNGTYGQMTYYSNTTHDWFYELAEMIEVFVATNEYGKSSHHG
jgi:hypothetical protein